MASQVKDPICGMTVDSEKSPYQYSYQGKEYAFCSEYCLEKFKQNPDQFIRVSKVPAMPSSNEYICPMHPEIKQSQSGPCPKCGMALEPKNPIATSNTIYTCPMHPEIQQDHPGNCPICGMALEPKTIDSAPDDSEYRDMFRRFWIGAILSIFVLFLAMGNMIPALDRIISPNLSGFLQFIISTPVILWCGQPLFQRGFASLVNRHLNMFSLN